MTPQLMIKIVMTIAGIIFLILFLYLTGKRIQFLKIAAEAPARVVNILPAQKAGQFTPVVEFKAPSGEAIRFSPPSSGSEGSYLVDQELTVIFDPEFPEDAIIKSFFELWIGSLTTFVAAALFLIPAIWISAGEAPAADTITAPPADQKTAASADPRALYFFYTLPGGFILFGIILMGVGMRNIYQMAASLRWPTAPGKVVRSEVATSGKYYSPYIEYFFRIGGKEYRSHNLYASYSVGESGDPLPSRRAVKRYPAGQQVTVHYNPENPEECALEPGIIWGELLLFFSGGAAFLFVAWVIIVALWKGWMKIE